MALTSGQTLNNRYRIVRLIGQGGFGAVYRAWDLSVNLPVALKENLDGSAEAQRQFQREAAVMARLRHPNLPRVTDYFSLPGQGQYLVMDFVEGQSLAELLQQRGAPFGAAEALSWVEQVCAALEYLHHLTPPIIHRDVKPQNVIITPEGRAMLVDFGISKLFDPQLLTTMGAKAVTPGYSPPEQYGNAITDVRADVYAMGATLYSLLTAQDPPESVDLVLGHAQLTPPRQLNGQVSGALEKVVLQAMAPTTGKRYQSIAELQMALRRLPPNSGRPKSLARQPQGKQPWVLAVAGLLLLPLLIFGGGRLLRGGGETTATPAMVAQPILTMTPTATTLPPSPSATPTTTGTPEPTATLRVTATPTAEATPTDDATPTGEMMVQAISGLQAVNVRAGPGVEFNIVASLTAGRQAEVLTRTRAGDWYNVRLPDGRRGWVAANVVQGVGDYDPAEAPVANTLPRPPATATLFISPTAPPVVSPTPLNTVAPPPPPQPPPPPGPSITPPQPTPTERPTDPPPGPTDTPVPIPTDTPVPRPTETRDE